MPAGQRPELKGSPESRAEELFALWQDYRRTSVEDRRAARSARREKAKYASQYTGRLDTLRRALADRWHDADVQKNFQGEPRQGFGGVARGKVGNQGLQGSKARARKHTQQGLSTCTARFSRTGTATQTS